MAILLMQGSTGMFYQQVKQLATLCHLQPAAADKPEQHMQLKFKDYRKDICSNNEISVKGRLYDVEPVTVIGQYADQLVICDICAEEVIDEVAKPVKRTNPQPRKIPQPLWDLFSSVNIFSDVSAIPHVLQIAEQLHGEPGLGLLCSNAPDIPCPPPQMI